MILFYRNDSSISYGGKVLSGAIAGGRPWGVGPHAPDPLADPPLNPFDTLARNETVDFHVFVLICTLSL